MKFSKKSGGKIVVTTECIPIPPSIMSKKNGTSAVSEEGGIDVFANVTIDGVTYRCTKFVRFSVQDNGPG